MVIYLESQHLGGGGKKKFKVVFKYIESLGQAWATRDPISGKQWEGRRRGGKEGGREGIKETTQLT